MLVLASLLLFCHYDVSKSFVTQWTVSHQVLCPRDFPGKSIGVGLPFPSPGDLPDNIGGMIVCDEICLECGADFTLL